MPMTRQLTESTLRMEHHRLTQQAASYRTLAAQTDTDLAALRERARADGLGNVLREIEAPPPVYSRVAEPTARVRVRESFSTEWAGIPYAGPAEAVIDLPRGLVRAAAHLFERVPDETPLHRPAPVAAWPR